MIREFHLADWFTLGNAVCGVGALFSSMTYLETADLRHVYFACALVLAALVASAIIAYACGMQGLYDRIVLAFFVACGVSRLARFNITAETLAEGPSGKVKYFEGTPIPTSIVLVGLLALAASMGAVREHLWLGRMMIGGFTLHPLVLLFALSGSLMISRIRIPKL